MLEIELSAILKFVQVVPLASYGDCYYGVYEGGSKGFTMFCGQLVARNLGNMVS